MLRYGVDPLVECRVQFNDSTLFPVRPESSRLTLRLAGRILDASSRQRERINKCPVWPTIVCIAKDVMWLSLTDTLKYDMTDGWPSGCLKSVVGSPVSQYSSSTSSGKSTSKLISLLVFSLLRKGKGSHVLFIPDASRST